MTPLIPDLERRLRQAHRRSRRADGAEGGPRRFRLSLGAIAAGFSVTAALAVAAVIVLTVHARGGLPHPASQTVGAPSTATTVTATATTSSQPVKGLTPKSVPVASCRPTVGPTPKGGITESSSILGFTYKLVLGPGPKGVEKSSLTLNRRAYGLCPLAGKRMWFRAIVQNGHVWVYGLFKVQGGFTARVGPGSSPSGVLLTPAETETFVLAELSGPLCRYPYFSLQIVPLQGTGPRAPALIGRISNAAFRSRCAIAAASKNPAAKGGPQILTTTTGNVIQLRLPRGLSASQRAKFRAGEVVVGEAGCLGCHQIGAAGNNGPGPALTAIGSKLSAAQIASALRNPKAPMPSFAGIPKAQFEQLVVFLSDLKR